MIRIGKASTYVRSITVPSPVTVIDGPKEERNMLSLRKTACYGNGNVGKSGKTFRLVRRRRYPTAAMAAMTVPRPYSHRSMRGTPRLVGPIQFQVDPRNLLPKVIVCK